MATNKTAKTKKRHWSYKLKRMYACTPAVKWARRQPDYRTAWNRCKRVTWLNWLACRTGHSAESWNAFRLSYSANDAAKYRSMVKRPSLEKWK